MSGFIYPDVVGATCDPQASRFHEAEGVLHAALALTESSGSPHGKSGQALLHVDAPLWGASNATFVDAVLEQKWATIEGLRWAPLRVVRLLQLERARFLARLCTVAMATGLEPTLDKVLWARAPDSRAPREC